MSQNKSLGKGLSALISDDSTVKDDRSYVPNIPIDTISPNRHQPRMEIKPETLLELADSIREHGVIEPLIVTQIGDNKYELIAGERRWRAAKLAGLKIIPCVIKEASQQQMLEMAIVENIQREDLNPLEEALAFKQLVDNYKMTHSEIAEKIALSRPAVANKIRLLNLPELVKKALLENIINEGHARALLGLNNPQMILGAYRKSIKEKLSVREVEELVRRLNQNYREKIRKKYVPALNKKTSTYEVYLRKIYHPKLQIYRSIRGGKIIIPFKNDEELEQMYSKLIKKTV